MTLKAEGKHYEEGRGESRSQERWREKKHAKGRKFALPEIKERERELKFSGIAPGGKRGHDPGISGGR